MSTRASATWRLDWGWSMCCQDITQVTIGIRSQLNSGYWQEVNLRGKDESNSFLWPDFWSHTPSFIQYPSDIRAFQVVPVVKNPPANARDIRDVGLIWGQKELLEEDMAIHASILAWRIPWTEKSGRLQSIALHGVRQDRSDLAHMHTGDINICQPYLKWRGAIHRDWNH